MKNYIIKYHKPYQKTRCFVILNLKNIEYGKWCNDAVL